MNDLVRVKGRCAARCVRVRARYSRETFAVCAAVNKQYVVHFGRVAYETGHSRVTDIQSLHGPNFEA